ncbi:UPF0046 protein C25E10.12 [Aphelenchoides fujianensis]|nr:UPF0046 protein C25E10.12 [Aphelenchoides fujianensis]
MVPSESASSTKPSMHSVSTCSANTCTSGSSGGNSVSRTEMNTWIQIDERWPTNRSGPAIRRCARPVGGVLVQRARGRALRTAVEAGRAHPPRLCPFRLHFGHPQAVGQSAPSDSRRRRPRPLQATSRNNGERDEILKFDEEMGTLPHPVRIVVAGNHELGFDDTEDVSLRNRNTQPLGTPKGYELLKNCTILHDRMVEVNGLKIYGSSWHPLPGYSFSCPRGAPLLEKWKRIPNGVDVLLTHTPPLGHSDVFRDGQHWGCAELLNTIERRVRPKLHVFGHVHERNGMTTNGQTVFVNASPLRPRAEASL